MYSPREISSCTWKTILRTDKDEDRCSIGLLEERGHLLPPRTCEECFPRRYKQSIREKVSLFNPYSEEGLRLSSVYPSWWQSELHSVTRLDNSPVLREVLRRRE